MSKRISTKIPAFMAKNPDPVLESRRFHDQEVSVFVGDLLMDKIEGWRGNPRTELHHERFLAQFGRPPSDEEMYELVIKDDDPKEGLKIIELAGNIHKNGVRVPIVVTYGGKLLDGNRRYYACLFLSKTAKTKQERDRFKQIPAYVLATEMTSDVENAIITEFNFAPDFHKEWPYYIRAKRVLQDNVENNMDKDALVSKYGVEWRYLSKWIQAARLCERFLDHHEQSLRAKQYAYRNFIMFDEMMRNYGKRFDDANFRKSVFDVLLADYDPDNGSLQRFSESSDVVRLDEIIDNPEAWEALLSRKGGQALKEALGIVEESNDPVPDPDKKLRSIIRGMEKLQKSGAINVADANLLSEFHQLSEQAPGAPRDPDTRVQKMIEWLDSMTARQISDLTPETIGNLRNALERVLKMAQAISSSGPVKKTEK